MKTVTVRLPDALVADIEEESRGRRVPKSDVIRERLSLRTRSRRREGADSISDLIGSVDGLPPDLSSRTKAHLKTTGYGRNRTR